MDVWGGSGNEPKQVWVSTEWVRDGNVFCLNFLYLETVSPKTLAKIDKFIMPCLPIYWLGKVLWVRSSFSLPRSIWPFSLKLFFLFNFYLLNLLKTKHNLNRVNRRIIKEVGWKYLYSWAWFYICFVLICTFMLKILLTNIKTLTDYSYITVFCSWTPSNCGLSL